MTIGILPVNPSVLPEATGDYKPMLALDSA